MQSSIDSSMSFTARKCLGEMAKLASAEHRLLNLSFHVPMVAGATVPSKRAAALFTPFFRPRSSFSDATASAPSPPTAFSLSMPFLTSDVYRHIIVEIDL